MICHIGTKPIETDRLLLRRYRLDDAQAVYDNWTSDPEASRFWTWSPHKDIDETRDLLRMQVEQYARKDNYNWTLNLKADDSPIGYIHLDDLNDAEKSATVHYLIARKLWGQGIATEALKAVLEYAFVQIGLHRVHTHHHVDNPASGAVMRKAGMRFLSIDYRHIPECERISGPYARYEILHTEKY